MGMVRPTDLPLLQSLSKPAVAPDGRRAVVAITRADLAADAYVGQLWEIPLDGGAPRRLTRGFRDAAPQFSADGSRLAFLRSEPNGAPQVLVVDALGGEPLRITDERLGVGEFRWSPDGTTIAYTARRPEPGRYGSVEGLDASAEPPRRLTTLRYRQNGTGYVTDRRAHVFLVQVPPRDAEPVYQPAPTPAGPAEPLPVVPEAVQLTTDDADYSGVDWMPDGTAVVAIAARHETRDTDLRNDAWLLPLDGGAPEALTSGPQLSISSLTVDPAGRLYLIAQDLGTEGTDFIGKQASLWLVEATRQARRLTDAETVDLGDPGSEAVLSSDGVLVQERSRGSVHLVRVTDDGRSERLTPPGVEVLATGAAGERVVVAYATGTAPAELGVLDVAGLRPVTDLAAPIAEGVVEGIELEIATPDGYPVHGWVHVPPGEGPHPVLLQIHGGPFTQYTSTFFDETQVYVEAGYAVVMCNPRGAAGYGEAHGRAIRRRMGTDDLVDVLAFLDGALEAMPDALDADRVGIMGGSYGGYLTAWTIAHDSRFAGAIVERGFLDPEAFVGTSDIGSWFGLEYVGTDLEQIRAQSPQAVIDRVSTPTLVIHSADDLRCPLGQAERYYAELKLRGVDTELLVFPGENHELSRSGRPRHRVQRFEAILEWWARHLPNERNRP